MIKGVKRDKAQLNIISLCGFNTFQMIIKRYLYVNYIIILLIYYK